MSMAPKRKSTPLQPGTLFVPELLHLPILLLPLFGSVMMMPTRHSQRTFLDEVFIWNAKSFWRTSSTLTYPLSFTVGNVPVTCPFVFIQEFYSNITGLIVQYLFSSLAFKVHTFLSHRNLLRMCFESLGVS